MACTCSGAQAARASCEIAAQRMVWRRTTGVRRELVRSLLQTDSNQRGVAHAQNPVL
jgi:hypothetical protein